MKQSCDNSVFIGDIQAKLTTDVIEYDIPLFLSEEFMKTFDQKCL